MNPSTSTVVEREYALDPLRYACRVLATAFLSSVLLGSLSGCAEGASPTLAPRTVDGSVEGAVAEGGEQEASIEGGVDVSQEPVEEAGPCMAKNCSLLGANCGNIVDNCDAKVGCGTCPTGQTCGGAGPNKCGTNACTAKTCAQLGASCGLVSDQCADVLDCGSCTLPDTCGGAGTPNQCGCQPKTCAQLGVKCGTVSDGCQGTVTCTDCGTATACTQPSQCSTGYCVDGFCCDTPCTGKPCQRCDTYSSQGPGVCGFVNSASEDPDNDCSTAAAGSPGSCRAPTCSGKDFSCGILPAGEGGQSACKRCDGLSPDPVSVADSTQDTEGTQVCSATCMKCSAGSCVPQSASEDLFSQCQSTGCGTGSCDGKGACTTSSGSGCPTCQSCEGGKCVALPDNSEDVGCNATCKGCIAGACGNIAAGVKDTWGANTCTAQHYSCSGLGACDAPMKEYCITKPAGQACSSVCSGASMQNCIYTSQTSSCEWWADCSSWVEGAGYCKCLGYAN